MGHPASGLDTYAEAIHRGQPVRELERLDLAAMGVDQQDVLQDEERVCAFSRHGGEGALEHDQ